MKTNIYAPVIVSVDNASVDANKRYGIKHSDTLDQTVAFQNMADDLAGYKGARTIILPAGNFHISDSINIRRSYPYAPFPDTVAQYESGFKIKGQGRTASNIIMDTAGKPAIRVYTEDTVTFRNIGYTFEGFGLYGQGTSDANTVGIQFGGVSTDRTDVIHDTIMRDMIIKSFASAMQFDDVTGLYAEQVLIEDFLYGIEMGFNIDQVHMNACTFGSGAIPVNVTCTTDSTTTVTTADTTKIRAGMGIGGNGIPAGTKVLSVTNGTDFELDTAATATGSSTYNFSQGTVLSYGAGGFAPPVTPSGSQNAHKFTSCWFMKNNRVADVSDTSAANIQFDSCYSERCNRFATLGNTSAASGVKNFSMINHHFSVPETFTEAAIWEDGGGADATGMINLTNCRSDGVANVPWIRTRSQKASINWLQNQLNVSVNGKIHLYDVNTKYSPANGTNFYIGSGGLNSEPIEAGVSGTIVVTPTPNADCSIHVGALTGAVAISTISAGLANGMKKGQRVSFAIEQDAVGGRSVTWNAAYKFHTAWSNIGNTANAQSFVDFYYDGTNFIQVSPANVWV